MRKQIPLDWQSTEPASDAGQSRSAARMMAFSHWQQHGRRMTARDLLHRWTTKLAKEQDDIATIGLDDPIPSVSGRLLQSTGTLHLYELTLPQPRVVEIDTPVTIVPPDEMEPTEGIVLRNTGQVLLVQ